MLRVQIPEPLNTLYRILNFVYIRMSDSRNVEFSGVPDHQSIASTALNGFSNTLY